MNHVTSSTLKTTMSLKIRLGEIMDAAEKKLNSGPRKKYGARNAKQDATWTTENVWNVKQPKRKELKLILRPKEEM